MPGYVCRHPVLTGDAPEPGGPPAPNPFRAPPKAREAQRVPRFPVRPGQSQDQADSHLL